MKWLIGTVLVCVIAFFLDAHFTEIFESYFLGDYDV